MLHITSLSNYFVLGFFLGLPLVFWLIVKQYHLNKISSLADKTLYKYLIDIDNDKLVDSWEKYLVFGGIEKYRSCIVKELEERYPQSGQDELFHNPQMAKHGLHVTYWSD